MFHRIPDRQVVSLVKALRAPKWLYWDLYEAGRSAALEAEFTFDSSKSEQPFGVYRRYKIRYALIDECRRITPRATLETGLRPEMVSLSAKIMNEEKLDYSGLLSVPPKAETDIYIQELLSCVSERTRQMIELYYFDGFAYKDIGGRFGISESAAFNAIHRGLARIRRTTECCSHSMAASAAA